MKSQFLCVPISISSMAHADILGLTKPLLLFLSEIRLLVRTCTNVVHILWYLSWSCDIRILYSRLSVSNSFTDHYARVCFMYDNSISLSDNSISVSIICWPRCLSRLFVIHILTGPKYLYLDISSVLICLPGDYAIQHVSISDSRFIQFNFSICHIIFHFSRRLFHFSRRPSSGTIILLYFYSFMSFIMFSWHASSVVRSQFQASYFYSFSFESILFLIWYKVWARASG
jgi:hypothetical protein